MFESMAEFAQSLPAQATSFVRKLISGGSSGDDTPLEGLGQSTGKNGAVFGDRM
jgi:hypothetical protein